MPRNARRTGAPPRARGRGGVPSLSLQRPSRGPLLAGRRCPQHAGPLDVRPPEGPDTGKGAAGKWTDAATGEHGDLLDVIRESCGLVDFRDVADEARRFLSLPRPEPESGQSTAPVTGADRIAGSGTASVRHVAADCRHGRGNVSARTRHHGFARHRQPALPSALLLSARRRQSPTETWPAMIAAVTDLDGRITGAHRTWLDPSGARQGADRYAAAGDGPSPRARASASAWRAT